MNKKIIRILSVILMLTLIPISSIGATKKQEKTPPKKTTWRVELITEKTEDGYVNLKWKKDDKADGYILYKKTEAEGKYQELTSIKGNKKFSYLDKKVEEGRDYYYSIRPYKMEKKKKVLGDYATRKRVTFFNDSMKIKFYACYNLDEEGRLSLTIDSHEYNSNLYIYERHALDAVGAVIDTRKIGDEGFQKVEMVSAYDYDEKDNCRWDNGTIIIPRGHKVKLVYDILDTEKELTYNRNSSEILIFARYGGRDYSIKWNLNQGAVEERI